MISILMSWLGLSFLFPALDQPSPFQHLRSTITTITMHSPHSCNTDSIQASLRTWIDTTPRSPGGALPPGSVSSGAPQTPRHSHVLNIELQLHNSSEQTQQVQMRNRPEQMRGQRIPEQSQQRPAQSQRRRKPNKQRQMQRRQEKLQKI